MVKHFGTLLVCACCLVLCVYASTQGQPSDAGDPKFAKPIAALSTSKTATVEMHLKIEDPASSFTLEATKDVPTGTNAFEALSHVVVVDHKRVPGIGRFITGLCGIEAARSQFWALYVDGDLSDKGISSIRLDADTEIEWKLQRRDTLAR